MMQVIKHTPWFNFLLIILVPIVGMVLGVTVSLLLGINQTNFSNLVINLFFLAGCISLIPIFKFTQESLGLKIIKENLRWHVFVSMLIFILYILYYILIIRITGLRGFNSNTASGLLTYLVVAIAEELYFRGMLYAFFQSRYSGRAALVVSSILFGLFHARDGIAAIITRTFTGWLWGSVRYSSSMIFLLIFPIHFTYNAIWLLFEGNWSNPPTWGIYVLPLVEFFLGLGVVILRNRYYVSSNDDSQIFKKEMSWKELSNISQ
jgi:membrane protease YdiL (CAAX protease family)